MDRRRIFLVVGALIAGALIVGALGVDRCERSMLAEEPASDKAPPPVVAPDSPPEDERPAPPPAADAKDPDKAPDKAPDNAANAARKRYSRPYLIRFEGAITPLTEQYLIRKLADARADGADLVAIEIESPGGLLEPSLAMAAALRDVQWARTVAYVPNEALSGAAIAALGCDEIVMGPHAKIGDAGAIYRDEAGMFQHAPEKIRSHLARHVRDLAQAKGRPPALAEAMVDKDLAVYRVRDVESQRETFLSDAEIRADERPERWKKLAQIQEAGAGNFFEVGGHRALELKFADGVATDRDDLARRYQLEAPWKVVQPGAVDTAVLILNLPLVTGLLLVIGLIALFIEVTAPGTYVGGSIAAICFSLFFWSRFLGGTSGWLEVVLFLLGAVFLALEIFVIPGFGVIGLLGLLLMGGSLVMASQDFVMPHSTSQWQTFSTTLLVLAGVGVTFLVAAGVLGRNLKAMPLFSRLVLAPPADGPNQGRDVASGAGAANVGAGGADMGGGRFDPTSLAGYRPPVAVGDRGTAECPLRPAGKIRVGDRSIDVVADGTFVDAGATVQVVQVQGNRVVVRPLPADAPRP